jgi:hypothetical protein
MATTTRTNSSQLHAKHQHMNVCGYLCRVNADNFCGSRDAFIAQQEGFTEAEKLQLADVVTVALTVEKSTPPPLANFG